MKEGRNIIGRKIEHFKEVDSTNDVAKKLAKDGAAEGTVVIADVQKKGRGRYDRSWSSPPAGIWLSVILRPDTSSERVSLLPLIAGSAVANTLNGLYGLDSHVRWPNDVLIGDKKAAGILTELDAGENFVVVGIGINANIDLNDLPAEVRETATTLKTELGEEVSKTALINHLFSEFEVMYDLFNSGSAVINSSTVNKRVKVVTKERELTGIAKEIDETGALILQLEDGSVERIISGDCIHLST